MKMKKKILIILAIIIPLVIVVSGFWYLYFRETDNSLANVRKSGVLKVGSQIPFGVMEFFDENNNPDGLDVDIAKELASRLGVRLEFNNYDWDDLFSKTKASEVDLTISSITITPERQKELLFSEPYFNGGQAIVVPAGSQDIKGVNDLTNKKIAVQKETTSFSEAKKYGKENLIFNYLDSDSKMVNDLKDGKVEVIIVDYTQALSMIKSYSGLKIVGVPFTKEDYGIATKIGNNSLMRKINSILEDMEQDGTLQKIKTKWTKF